MKNKTKKLKNNEKIRYQEAATIQDELFEKCIRKGLIEQTPYGYYFTPEFFETLEIYKED